MGGSAINPTKTTALPGVVNTIRLKSMKVLANDGVCRKLVHQFGGGDGYRVDEPVFDNSTYAGTVGTEGVAIAGTNVSTLSTTRRTYTATEQVFATFETYDSLDEASESVSDLHAQAHGHVHAEKMENKIIATFASFTTNQVVATSSTGLTWSKIARARTLLEAAETSAPKPYYYVTSPSIWQYFLENSTQNTTYGPVGTVADDLMKQYHVASLVGGVEVYWTPYIAAAATSISGLFCKEAIGLFVPREYRFRTQEFVMERGYKLVSSLKAGARVRKVSWGVKVLATGTALT